MNKEKKNNILLITTDTQRWDTLRCMGSDFAISPNLDRLASEGVMFLNAHTSSPVCQPARCSLLTGLHTPIHGCIQNGINRRTGMPTLPDVLEQCGYENIMVGKTHFGEVPKSFHVQHTMSELQEKGNRELKKLGFDYMYAYPNEIPESLYIDSLIVDATIEEIQRNQEQDEKPFFAFCSLVSPHGPITPPGDWDQVYKDIKLPPVNYQKGEELKHPMHMRKLLGLFEGVTNNHHIEYDPYHYLNYESGITLDINNSEEVDTFRKLYYGLAAYCDDQIGKLLTFLDDNNLRENTLIIFSSDHGQEYFDHGINAKLNYFDNSWRVPLIMSMKGTLPESETRNFAIWNDITTTIIAAAGGECSTMQGFDLFTPLSQGKELPRKCAVATLYKSAAVCSKRWKLEYYFEEGKGRLYDRLKDPMEQNDLYNNVVYHNLRVNLVEALLRWRADIMDIDFMGKNDVINNNLASAAKRTQEDLANMKGADSERRLNNAIVEIEERFSFL